jgi:hypothetical protein
MRFTYLVIIDSDGFKPVYCDDETALRDIIDRAMGKNISPSQIQISIKFTSLPKGVTEA